MRVPPSASLLRTAPPVRSGSRLTWDQDDAEADEVGTDVPVVVGKAGRRPAVPGEAPLAPAAAAAKGATAKHAARARLGALGINGDPTGKVVLDNTNHLVNEAINTLKDISNNLSPHMLSNFGLSSALSAFIAKINQTKVIEIDFKTNMESVRLETDREVVVYRAACELINNSIRHSGASRIEIDLNKHEKFITLQFCDNGRGFDTAILESEDTKGMGLSNIETRVRSVDGVFILESTPGKGTSALIKIIE